MVVRVKNYANQIFLLYYRKFFYLYFDYENHSVADEVETLRRQGQRPTPLISKQSGKTKQKIYIIIDEIFYQIIKS